MQDPGVYASIGSENKAQHTQDANESNNGLVLCKYEHTKGDIRQESTEANRVKHTDGPRKIG